MRYRVTSSDTENTFIVGMANGSISAQEITDALTQQTADPDDASSPAIAAAK